MKKEKKNNKKEKQNEDIEKQNKKGRNQDEDIEKQNKREEKQIIISKQENYIKKLKEDRKEKENNKQIRRRVIENLIIALALIIYFAVMFLIYTKVGEDKLLFGIKIFSLMILAIGILLFEIAYNKDSGRLAINGVEVLVLALYTLGIAHVKTQVGMEFNMYITYSLCVFIIYYILKTSLICTREKRKFANSLTDIHEIVIKEPIKKEAKRKKTKENI